MQGASRSWRRGCRFWLLSPYLLILPTKGIVHSEINQRHQYDAEAVTVRMWLGFGMRLNDVEREACYGQEPRRVASEHLLTLY